MRLSDILSGGNGNGIDDLWDATAAADDFGPLPPGEYIAHLTAGELIQSRTNQTPGYRMTFTVVEGDYTKHRFWHECWLTAAALSQSKRDLKKIGIEKPAMMEKPIPKWLRCKCKVALRKDDQGNESNRLKTFEVIGIDKPTVDEFAIDDTDRTMEISRMKDSRHGYRIVGALHGERRYTIWHTAFAAYATCDPRAKLESEAYLSAFTFGDAFKQHLEATGSTKDYHGDCFASWLWFDIDRTDVGDAIADARKLASSIVARYGCNEPLIFFSGSKGFHIGLPTSLWNPEPSTRFNRYAKAYAVFLAALAGVTIDESVYDKVRAFRAPNSRHQKTGCFKRFLTMDELLGLRVDRIIELAKKPEPFEVPTSQSESYDCLEDWKAACGSVDALAESASAKRSSGEPRTNLNRSTLAYIRESADVGDRHPALFRAAANLAEFGCSFSLAWALLSESALDSGLSPSDVRRQIECGLKHKGESA